MGGDGKEVACSALPVDHIQHSYKILSSINQKTFFFFFSFSPAQKAFLRLQHTNCVALYHWDIPIEEPQKV